MSFMRVLCLAVLVLAVHGRAAHAAAATLLIDRPAGFGALPSDATNESHLDERHAISGLGTYVVFTSSSDALLPAGVPDGPIHAFRRNLSTGVTELIDRRADGTVSPDGASNPVISANGKVVAFLSYADLTGNATGGSKLYVKNMETGAVEFCAGYADHPVLDEDGSRVAFESTIALDAAHDKNLTLDVYRRDLPTDATVLISRANGAGDSPSGADGHTPAIDLAGDRVAFSTVASYSAGDTNTARDVYVGTGATTILASALDGQATTGTGEAFGPTISANGKLVAFTSTANLAGPGSGMDVFVRDITNQKTTNVSRPSLETAVAADGPSHQATISPDGTRVAFVSLATNLVATFAPAHSYAPLLYVRTLANNETELVSRDNGPSGAQTTRYLHAPSVNGSGQILAFEGRDPLGGRMSTESEVWVRNTAQKTTVLASAPSGAELPAALVQDSRAASSGHGVSADGRYVVFGSEADGLSDADDDDQINVYVRDVLTGAVAYVNHNGAAAANAESQDWTISADGSHVAFVSEADNLGFGPLAGAVYVYDLRTGELELAGRADGSDGAVATDGKDPVLSADGRRIAFVTRSTLDAADANIDKADVYLRDLATDTTMLVSRAPGVAGAGGAERSTEPALSADGHRVAFVSGAGNLGESDGDTSVWLRDLDAATTELVSRADGVAGEASGKLSTSPTISADGRRVAFLSNAPNLGDGDAGSGFDVHVRDLEAGTTVLASRAGADGPAADGSTLDPVLSADGTRVAFASYDDGLLPVGVTLTQVFVRDLAARTLSLVSRTDGAGGAPANDESFGPSISADGGCVAFGSEATGLEPDGYPSSDYEHVHLRVVSGECPRPAAPVVTPAPTAAPTVSPTASPGAPVMPVTDRTAPRITSVKVTRRLVRFTLSEAARVRILVRRGKHAKTLMRTGKAGRTTVRVRLKRRRYRVSLRATDAAGNRSKTVVKKVRVRR